MTEASTTATDADRRDALGEQLLGAALGALDIYTVYLGDRLGFYEAMAGAGAMTSTELAAATSTQERYVREWLEQQAMSGIVDVEDESADGSERRYVLPVGHAQALLGDDNLYNVAPFAQLTVGIASPIEALVAAFQQGGGVPYADYGVDMLEGQARFTRPLFNNLLGSDWIPNVPAIHERLQADPPARVADVACGAGWSSIALARAYAKVRVDGLDLDEASIEAAGKNLAGSGVEDRVQFEVGDGADPQLAHQYDLVMIFESLHDMSKPVEVLSALRNLVAEDGIVMVGDERVADAFSVDAGEIERLYYGFSVLHCLPAGLAEVPSAGTGTVMRAGTVREYAKAAGFQRFEVLPIENEFWRFYGLSG